MLDYLILTLIAAIATINIYIYKKIKEAYDIYRSEYELKLKIRDSSKKYNESIQKYIVNPEAEMKFYFDPRFKEANRFTITAINSNFTITITRKIFNELFTPPAIDDDNSYNSSLIKIKDTLPMATLNKHCKLLFHIETNTVRPLIKGRKSHTVNFISNRFRLEAEGMSPLQSLFIDEELFNLMFVEYDPSKEVTDDSDNTISTENIIQLNKQEESPNESN